VIALLLPSLISVSSKRETCDPETYKTTLEPAEIETELMKAFISWLTSDLESEIILFAMENNHEIDF
jgi:hypothetical protein